MTGASRPLRGADFQRMAIAAAVTIDSEQARLSRLDAAGGDGDHGANMQAGMTHARSLVEQLNGPTPTAVLEALVVAFQEHMGGAGGVLLGEFFAGVASVVRDRLEVDGSLLAEGLTAGLARIQRTGKAGVGDRTMVDALSPATTAATGAASMGEGPADVLDAAAEAAEKGAEATREMAPKLGRARYAPDRASGAPDPGATSIALILSAWGQAAREGTA